MPHQDDLLACYLYRRHSKTVTESQGDNITNIIQSEMFEQLLDPSAGRRRILSMFLDEYSPVKIFLWLLPGSRH